MDQTRIDNAAQLLREREARSLMLLCAVGLAGFVSLGVFVQIDMAADRHSTLKRVEMAAFFGAYIVVLIGVLIALRKRYWVGGAGIIVALLAATAPALSGVMMWQGALYKLPVTILAKLPIAEGGIAIVAAMALTLRPICVIIVGMGLALTLLGFYGIAAIDPLTTLVLNRTQSLIGSAISPFRLFYEMNNVAVATACTAIAAYFARRTIREAVALQRTTDQLSRYFSPDIANGIRDGGEAFLRPGGREQEVVVLFSDLAGYTRLCADLPASQALALLSEYHERMVAEIFNAGGTLDKFIGDGIMATFGTPLPSADAADRAVRAARGMMTALTALNEDRARRGLPALVQRIGIHAGLAAVGNVGTAQRLEFTVIGDTVNVASRIEAACKKTGQIAMISAAVVSRLSELMATEPLGPVSLDGQPAPVELYALSANT